MRRDSSRAAFPKGDRREPALRDRVSDVKKFVPSRTNRG